MENPARTGNWEEAAPVRTLWIAPVGNSWVVAAQHPGLFVATGQKLGEVIIARYHHKLLELPAATEKESESLSDCRQLMEANALTEGIFAHGSGLTLRDLSSGAKTPLLPSAQSLEDLEYPSESIRYTNLLGGLGQYLFVRVSGYNQPCGMRAFDYEEFEIVDLTQGTRVTKLFSGSEGDTPWKKYFDLEKRRQELAPMMKKQLREYDPDTANDYDPKNLYVNHFYPVFPDGAANVGFQVAYRYWAGCRACPSFDGFALAEDLPPEMQEYATMHPSIAAARAALPRDWRIGGLTLLSASPAEVLRLRRLFEARSF